ncbi:MAG: hypothetical protein K2P87_07040 [Lachnospiraceae bacterium]|nr:hypothetical protein [Lachnospiraceae bacterium]
MKRVIRYISFVLVLGMMFSTCYYLSYRNALKKLRRMENKQSMDALFDEQMMLAERMFLNLTGSTAVDGSQDVPVLTQPVEGDGDVGEDDGEPAVTVNRIEPERIFSGTKIVAETYDTVTGVFTMQETIPDSAMIGMTRDELVGYLAEEFENMPLSEQEKGLLSNELITFSKDKVILRKTYDSGQADFLYYIAVKNGEVVVYHNDRETVFEYTGISAIGLKEEERLALMEGIRVRTAEELFSLLESYSS